MILGLKGLNKDPIGQLTRFSLFSKAAGCVDISFIYYISSKTTHRFSVTLSFAPKRSSDRSLFNKKQNKIEICLTSASARNSESQRIDASSLIFQLMYALLCYHTLSTRYLSVTLTIFLYPPVWFSSSAIPFTPVRINLIHYKTVSPYRGLTLPTYVFKMSSFRDAAVRSLALRYAFQFGRNVTTLCCSEHRRPKVTMEVFLF